MRAGEIRYLVGASVVVSYLLKEAAFLAAPDPNGDEGWVWECDVTKAGHDRFECWTALYPEDYLATLPEDP